MATFWKCHSRMAEKDVIHLASLLIAIFVSIPAWCVAAFYIPEVIAIVFVLFILTYYLLMSMKHSLTTPPILFTIFSAFGLVLLDLVLTYYTVYPDEGFFCHGYKLNYGQSTQQISWPNIYSFHQHPKSVAVFGECENKNRYATLLSIFLIYTVVNIFAVFLLYHLRFVLLKLQDREDLISVQSKMREPPSYEDVMSTQQMSSPPIPPVFHTVAPFTFPDDGAISREANKGNATSLMPHSIPIFRETTPNLTAQQSHSTAETRY